MRQLIVLLSLFVTTLCYSNTMEGVKDSTDNEETIVANEFLLSLDSMTNWLFAGANKYRDTTAFNVIADSSKLTEYPDSVIVEKMALIPSEIDLSYNVYVKRYIELYTVERREQVSKMLMLSQLYFPYIEEALDRRNMPHELRFLPIVESALNPHAVSRVGATGMWQIMYSTGRMLDLNINSYIDERRDPQLSTEAALDYLQRLHNIYGDWLLAIAAYNCGPGNVNKAIRRSGYKRNFWEIRRWLPRETRGYVPAFIAATYMMIHFEDYSLAPKQSMFEFNTTDTVKIYKNVSLAHISKHIDMDVEELYFVNPSLKKRVIPALRNGYALKLPIDKVALFEDSRDSIFNGIADAKDQLLAKTGTSLKNLNTNPGSSQSSKLYYTVKAGDNLSYIAEWYDCSAQRIRSWNGINGNTINVGKKLRIYVPTSRVDQYADISSLSFREKQAREGKTVNYSSSNSTSKKATSYKGKALLSYKVKSGDNLGFIAEWYDCRSQDIRNWNGIYGNTINVGQSLKIYVSESKKQQYTAINTMSMVAKQAIEAKQNSGVSISGTNAECNCEYYEVKPGDTLWDISKKYPGVSVDKIKKSNNIRDSYGLKPGMKLKIEI